MDLKKFFGKKICVAVSGGVDSVSLLHYLKTLETECGYTLSVVHCEHGIRGEESLADARFVEELCRRLGVEFSLFSVDCPALAKEKKQSLETVAREFRRECFAKLIDGGKADLIATAHHQNDAAETVLFRLSRGTALSGAKGIEEETGYFIRPFLGLSRKEIEIYAKENGLEYHEDKTNADMQYSRNKIRGEVLPKLEEVAPEAAANIARFAQLAKEDDELLYAYSNQLVCVDKGQGSVAFCEQKPLFTRACLTAMRALGVEKDYAYTHLAALFDLQYLERGASLDLPDGLRAKRMEKSIVFYKETEIKEWKKGAPKKFDENGFDGGRYAVNVFLTPPSVEKNVGKILTVDGDQLPAGAVFRFRKEGDYIQRFGGGTKTLKKFFNERKTPVEEREYLPLIAANEEAGEVFVVCGEEISERVKITEKSKRILYITIEKKEN